MKLIYKGVFRGEDQLPKGVLPEKAVAFREPDSMLKINLMAVVHLIPAVILIFLVARVTMVVREDMAMGDAWPWNIVGLLLSLLCILPHELLHGVCFGKDAEVELYASPKDLMAFVVCTEPVSKWRFIFMSLCPALVLGWIPLLLWTVLPYHPVGSTILFYFAVGSICVGGADYMNVFNALRQMPRGSVQQLSGMHSYWYMP